MIVESFASGPAVAGCPDRRVPVAECYANMGPQGTRRGEMPQADKQPAATETDPSAVLGGDRPDCLSVRNGRLFVEDCDATGLVERFGSPIFVTSETQLRANVRRLQKAFEAAWPDGPVDVLPAFKANTTLATRHILSSEGAGADVYSPEELAGVLATGVDPVRVSVNGGGKSRDHLRRCVAAGVRITVEDVHEIDLIQEVAADLGATARIRFRVKPVVPGLWRRTDFSQLTVPIDLGIQVYKSGIPPEYLVEMGRRVFEMPNVELVGLHLHAGRHHPSLWFWEGLMTHYGRLVGELCRAWDHWKPGEIDVGGGMASPRDPHNKELPRSEFLATALGYPFLVGLRALGDRLYHAALSKIVSALTAGRTPKAPPALESYASTIAGTLRAELRRQGVPTEGVRLQTEPGRSLYGDTGVHLARVKVVKRQTRPIPYTWVLTDTTVFFLAGGVLEHNRHPVLVANRADEPATMKADVVGHSCYADQIVLGADLPEVAEGDVVALLETGAYQESSASNFNALPRPATVLVHGADAEIVKVAETGDDIYARDQVPDRVRTPPRGAQPETGA
jgi:diaminopimelate decarboxylase